MSHGFLLSLVTVFIWAIGDVLVRYMAVTFHIKPFIFTCLYMIMGALTLILIAGPGKGGLNTLRLPHTWAFGLMEILMHLFQIYALLFITTTEMNFLNRMSSVMVVFLPWMFFGSDRRPTKMDIVGAMIVAIGLIMIAIDLDPAIRAIALFNTFMVSLTVIIKTMIAETHPEAIRALTIKERCRVTGYVLLSTSWVFLTFTVVAGLVKNGMPDGIAMASMLPDLEAFWHLPTLYSAAIFGILLFSCSKFYFFYAVSEAKTETFIGVATLTPLLTLGTEYIAHLVLGLDISGISAVDIIAGCIMIFGAFLAIADKMNWRQKWLGKKS